MGTSIPEITLHDGTTLPVIGLGTYGFRGNAGVRIMANAIDVGYRLIDSAFNYENEGTVGEAIRRSSVPREQLKITSKLPGRYHTYELARKAIEESLFRANLDYYDMYLIHWPNPKRNEYVEAWQALIDAKKAGFIRSIGVCNFHPEYMERLEKETGVKPSLNQIELHPFFNQEKLRKWHESEQIQTQAWSPLARGTEPLQHEVIGKIAEKHEKSISQIILRWHYQLGNISIPKSSSPAHQLANISIFDFTLNEAEMNEIGALTTPNGRLNNQDPAQHEEL